MSDETLTLSPRHNGKIGSNYCGVTRDGFIAVAGSPKDIADGEEIVFDHVSIKARREGDVYTFSRC